MTERDWLECGDHRPMLAFLQGDPSPANRISERTLRLYACGCCRLIWDILPYQCCRWAVEATERYADGEVNGEAVAAEHELLNCVLIPPGEERGPGCQALMAAFFASLDPGDYPGRADEKSVAYAAAVRTPSLVIRAADPSCRASVTRSVADLLRDVFGNPSRQVEVDPTWLTWDVTALARGIQDDRACDRMLILADALEDAGCADEEVLRHSRSGGAHIRGCWLLDVLLAKA